MNKAFLTIMIVVLLLVSMPSKASAMGLLCPAMWSTFNETTLDTRILSVLEGTVSGYVTDYTTTVSFGPIDLGKGMVKRFSVSYNLHNTHGLLAKLYFTDITPLLGRTVVTECNLTRGPSYFGIRIIR